MHKWCIRMDNHNRSKKHAENVSRLLLELTSDDDDDEDNKDDNIVDDATGNVNAADADDDDDDDDVSDDLPDPSLQSRYYLTDFTCFCRNLFFRKLKLETVSLLIVATQC